MGRLNFFNGDHEVRRFTSDILAVVVGRKRQLEGLALTGLHAANCRVKLLEHLTITDDELKVVGLASGESFAINLAFKVDRHAIPFERGGVLRTLGKCAPLFAQDVQRFVNCGVGHLG